MLECSGGTTPGDATRDDLRRGLIATLAQEAELLRELREVFRRQRVGVLEGRAADIDDGVFTATRMLRTLGEARAARKQITLRLFGSSMEFQDLDDGVLPNRDADLERARDEVRSAARGLLEEAAVLRGSLEVLLDDNRRCLDALLGGPHGGAALGGQPMGPPDRSGLMLDRHV